MNIVAFKDATIHGNPCPDVVAKCEELLEMAKAGELRGLAYITTHTQDSILHGWCHAEGEGHRISTGILRLTHAFTAAWVDG